MLTRCRGVPCVAAALGIGLMAVAVLAGAGLLASPDATEIVRRADLHLRGTTSFAEYTMRLERPTWSRVMAMKSWSKGTHEALILVTAPARDRGTSFLKRGDEVWNWVPSVERVIKIPPSMMSQSWMGSDFTNEDLVKESSIVDDYAHEIVGDTAIERRPCWKIRMIPKPDAAVVWGAVVIWISKQDDLEMRAEYYDEDGALVHVMQMSQVRKLGGRLLPTVMTMTATDKPGNRTLLIYKDAWFDRSLSDDFFSEQNMKRVR
jgi:outer membrane lipoprotein-sorting protein